MARRKPVPPTHYYVVCLSIVARREGSEWVAIVTDMPLRATGATKEEATRAVKLLALAAMSRGEGPLFSQHEEIAASVAEASINAVWRVVNEVFGRVNEAIGVGKAAKAAKSAGKDRT